MKTTFEVKLKTVFIFAGILAAVILIGLNFGIIRSSLARESANQAALRIFNACLKSSGFGGPGTETCYYKNFIELGEDNGPEFSFKALSALQRRDEGAIGCHFMAHGIGVGSYRRNPNGWQELIRNIDSTCSYGAPHGVLEEYFTTSGQRMTKEFIPRICGPNPRADCNHIVGHLILVEAEANIEKAIELCGVFKDDVQREFCLTGVFMEYQTATNLIVHGYAPESWKNWPARVPELEKVCRTQIGENAVACWKEIVHAALAKFHNDPQKIFDFCNSAQIVEGAIECKHHAIGIMAAGKNFDLENVKSMCLIPQKNEIDFEGACYAQLASSAISTTPTAADSVRKFCQGLETQYQSVCLARISTPIKFND